MSPKDVYGMREEYQQYPYINFRTNLNNLRKSIQKLQGHADEDSAALAHDLEVRPRLTKTPRGYPVWDGSAAERFLKLDIDRGEHEKMNPRMLRGTRKEYEEFPLEVFRDHIYQEVLSRTASLYWSTKKKKY